MARHPGQATAAKVFGVKQSTIARTLSGELQPSLKILMGLREATGRSVDDLLGLTARSKPDLERVLSELAEIRSMVEPKPPKR